MMTSNSGFLSQEIHTKRNKIQKGIKGSRAAIFFEINGLNNKRPYENT
jgi:hypothetical protein